MLLLAAARIDDVLARAGCGANELPTTFGDAERARWTALTPSGRSAFVASRLLMRSLLERATGIAQSRWTLSAVPGRAPTARSHADIADLQQHDCPLSISLSHRLGWVCAATGRGALGVDIEVERPSRSDLAERAALMLAPDELPTWYGLAPHARESALLTRWTVKEAWFKASSSEVTPWDFRHVVARACAPALANVRTWRSPPLHVAVCCADAQALAGAVCDGLPTAAAAGSFWHVAAT